ncbi:MAG: UDP-N-acetylmuramate--L-alanine ligase [Anaerovorax sp.]
MLNLSQFTHIHCIGIGGIGLSAIAEIFLSRGYRVTGSDMKESELTDKLIQSGASVFLGHREKNVEGADLVIYSAAVSPDNPELKKAIANGVRIASRAEVLGALMEEYKNSIAVSGTHGKTTTTSMIALILEKAQKDPTILVGGNLSEINGNVKVGGSEYFITEACEYMDSFLSLRPNIEIILNIDSDHLDFFKDIDHIVSSFHKFAQLIPKNGVLVAYEANPFVSTIIKSLDKNVITFGFNEQCDFYVTDIQFNSLGMPEFQVNRKGGQVLCNMHLSVPGEHNIANALAAFACCQYLGVPIESIVSSLEAYTGTQRRFDVIGITKNNIRVIDDYAHHPTEIKATLKAAQNVPHHEIWCLFQPHTYTRTLALFDDFAESFALADKIIMAEIYAAREKNIYKISSKELMNEIKRTYPTKDVYYFPDFESIADFVINNASDDDLVITMGAGDIYKVAEIILEKDRIC